MKNLSQPFIIFILGVWTAIPQTQAAPHRNCNSSKDQSNNLEFLLDWCEKHKVADDDCTEFLQSAEEMSTSGFRDKLNALVKNKSKDKDSQSTQSNFNATESPPQNISSNAGLNSKAPQAENSIESHHEGSNFQDHKIPTDGHKAFDEIKRRFLDSPETSSTTIDLHTRVSKTFKSLQPQEIKTTFEVLEILKSKSSVSEALETLKVKSVHKLKSESLQNCAGEKHSRNPVYSVRLSQSARMCFEFTSTNPVKVRINCIGSGRACYEH